MIAAPTGSGKTLAAFLAAIDGLVRQGVRHQLPDEIQIVYVSPLKALSNDIQKNLDEPLRGIREELGLLGFPEVEIRTLVRTGDTPQAERERMRRKPPHILVTTPESLYILLTSESGRKALATTQTVIVDEIHALAPNKRGAHLSLCLERLEHIANRRITRVGLSATQRPIEDVAQFLVGRANRPGKDLFDAEAAPTAQAPSCLIVDQTMPGMTGLDLMRALHGDPEVADIPVYFYSAAFDQGKQREAQSLGAKGWYIKGISRLSDLMDNVIASAGGEVH